jgi:hypothetical protein
MRAKLVAFLLAIVLAQHCAAGTPDCLVEVGFYNGVLTGEQDAGKEDAEIVDHLVSAGLSVQPAESKFLYHRDAGLDNISQVFWQKEVEAKGNENLQLTAAERYYILTQLGDDAIEVWKGLVTDPIAGAIAGLVGTLEDYLVLNSLSPTIASSVTAQVSDDVRAIQRVLKSDRPLLIVAHSQGNLYTNVAVAEVYKSASPDSNPYINDRLMVLGLGVPAGYIIEADAHRGDGKSDNYVTNSLDLVIERLRVVSKRMHWAAPLSWNAKNPPHSNINWSVGHTLVDTYLNKKLESGIKSIAYARTMALQLSSNCEKRAEKASNPLRPDDGVKLSVLQTEPKEVGSLMPLGGADASATPGGGPSNRQSGASLSTPREADENSRRSLLLVADEGERSPEFKTPAGFGGLPPPFPKVREPYNGPLPPAVGRIIEKAFYQDDIKRAAQAFVAATLYYWNAGASQGWQYKDEAPRRDSLEAQVCLKDLIDLKIRDGGFLSREYLRLLLVPLTSYPQLFALAANSDAAASGHPITLYLDRGRACQAAFRFLAAHPFPNRLNAP